MSEQEQTPPDATGLERHRAFVRETDKSFSTYYGAGGACVLGAGALVLVVAWLTDALGHLAVWVVAITACLVALGVLSSLVRKRRKLLADRVQQYCAVNDLDPAQLRDYYAAEGIYPYFLSILGPESRP